MLHTSHPIGAATVGKYYAEHYSSSQGQYYTEGHALEGQWHGQFAAELGLVGPVGGEAFERLVNGQNPASGEQWIKHRATHLTASGKELPHRAAWDLTFNAPKEVSLTALVGGDVRVREAHRAAVKAALDAGEMYTQSRGGGDRAAVTTGKWIVAQFEHDTARPERLDEKEGAALYPAPHLHTHAVMMNLTVTDKPRSLETGELFKAQQLMKAVYQSELKHHLREFGYEVHEGKNGAAEIQGFTKEYLEAESLRGARIKARMQELGLSGRRAEEIIQHQDRNEKLSLNPEEVRALHLARAAEYGNQPEAVVLAAAGRRLEYKPEHEMSAYEAVTFAKRSVTERLAVFDHFQLVSEALKYGRGYVRVGEVERNIAERRQAATGKSPEFITVQHGRPNAPGRQYTTREMVSMEREVLKLTAEGRGKVEPIAKLETAESLQRKYRKLNGGFGINVQQAQAAAGILTSPDRVTGLQGVAGSGKTSSTLKIVTDFAKASRMEVVGLAPTGRARKELEAAGIPAQTLQRFLIRNEPAPKRARLFIVDESSLVSTKQYQEFLTRMRPGDRVLEVGDVRQHESVEAARIFEEQQKAGMRTAHLTHVVRQKNPEILAVVNSLQEGKASSAVKALDAQGRVDMIEKRAVRLDRIAADYVANPAGTLVISPDNASRQELNDLIREKLQAAGSLGVNTVTATILVGRQDLTKESRKLAASYQTGDVIRFQSVAAELGVKAKAYATVIDRDTEKNSITARLDNGKLVTYNPKRHYGVEIFEQQLRPMAPGDEIVFRMPWKERGITTGDRATIETLDPRGNVKVRMDEKSRAVNFNLAEMRHFDYGYASTSYGAQGATVDRVLVHMNTAEKGAKVMLNSAMAYVSLSRPRNEIKLYTDDVKRLERMLENSEVKKVALAPGQVAAYGMERSV